LNLPEKYIDKYYEKGSLIISKSYTKLADNHNKLVNFIEEYSNTKNNIEQKKLISRIIKILNEKNMNYSEFVSYWTTKDVSYSLYKKMNSETKLEFIKHILKKYIKERHKIYLAKGYSEVTLQSRYDSSAHKKSGQLGKKKLIEILEHEKYINYISKPLSSLINDKNWFFMIDNNKTLFNKLITKLGLNFTWRTNHQNKYPDVVVKIGSKIYIIEHKHMNEGGGGQDKQISELIEFIKYSDNNVSYVSFLDGIYFNKFNSKNKSKKLKTQLAHIEDNLNNNPNNYFVNTAGFKKLIKDL